MLGHRYYDSSIGRFLTRDPAKDGKNWYSYCRNNPVDLFDKNGLSPEKASGATKGLATGILGLPGYVDGDGQLVIGEVVTGRRGLPWVDKRSLHFDYPHGQPGWKSAKPHINSDVIKAIDHAEISPITLNVGKPAFIKGLGKAALVAGIAYDVVTIANSDDPVQETVKSLTVWGGAATGAAIGTGICPGLGTFVGGLIGGLVTATIVYWND